MRKFLLLLWLAFPLALSAAVINVEFKFTPFVGDPENSKEVETVAGQAHVFLNNVPIADQEVQTEKVPVLFDDHEIAASVWVPVKSLGAAVHKGKNVIRVDFTPNDTNANYRAQLRWAAVTDQSTETHDNHSGSATNQADEGVLDRKAKGKISLEKEFTADFATDQPWHHYPAITELTESDKQKIATLLATRAAWFKPDFAEIYRALAPNEDLHLDEIKKQKCLDAAYQAGVRVQPPVLADLEFTTTGNPEVVVAGKKHRLFGLDEQAFAGLKDEEMQMCAGMTMSILYPDRQVVVRDPQGNWKVIF